MIQRILAAGLVAASGFALIGCDAAKNSTATTTTLGTNATSKGEGEHGHQKSLHGGIIVPIGYDAYHAEAVFEKGGILRLYTLGANESLVAEVEAQPLTGYIKIEGEKESESIVLAPKPQPDDKSGMTSQFVGHLPKEAVGKKFEVMVPSIRIEGKRYHFSFKSVPDSDEHGMPAKVADDEERKLYLTPGGKYSDADIKANGNVTASAKFKGYKAEHDLKPKAGEKICPITLTKANPKFTWIVGGKSYEFCCPPCVDEFVALAKEKPDDIQDPETYRKK